MLWEIKIHKCQTVGIENFLFGLYKPPDKVLLQHRVFVLGAVLVLRQARKDTLANVAIG